MVATADPAADWAGTGTADASADAWGAPTAAAADAWGPSGDSAPAPAGDSGKPEGRSRRDREPEEEDNTLTLSQYLAQQKEKESVIPKLENTRKANEGAGDDLWKDSVPLSKNEEEGAYFVGKVCHFSFFCYLPLLI
jgi:plasminogen activator inhibitor 1 RNA-binding protein